MPRHVLAPGKFYPGTPHNYQVYVPAQRDPGRPLPFMIFLDGSGYAGDNVRVPVVLDNLIAKRDVPPMAAIFIDPGVMPALSEAAQNRCERIFEYDSLTPRFANFLVEELIPEVAKLCPLSSDPNDRGIAGLSTGGVLAGVGVPRSIDAGSRVGCSRHRFRSCISSDRSASSPSAARRLPSKSVSREGLLLRC